MRIAPFIPLIALSIGLLSCSKVKDPAVAPLGSTVSITSISPPSGQFLLTGRTVKFKVNAAYYLSAETGSIALVVQSSDGATLIQDEKVVKKGGGEVTFEREFVVPDSNALRVFVPLSADGQSATSTMDTRVYAVNK